MITYSIIQKSQLEGARRIDAEYYQPEYLQYIDQLQHFELHPLDSLTSKIDVGFVSSMVSHFQSEGIPLLRTQNVQEFLIDPENDVVYIDEEFHNKLRKSQVFPGYLLLARSGSIGNVGVVPDKFPITNSADIILIKVSTDRLIPEFLAAFLNSKYGRFQVERGSSGGLQGHINLYSLEKLQVPITRKRFQEEVKNLVLSGLNLIEESKRLYDQADALLLEELALKDVQVEEDLSFIVNLSDVNNVSRADADYFQPKYEKLISKLELKAVNKLEDFVKDYSTGFPFKSENYQEDGIPLIRINNIKKGFIDLSDTAYLSDRDYSLSPKDIAKSGDVVLSMSGTIGMSAVIPVDVPKCSVNQRILRFSSKNIDSDYLVLVLNSIVGFYQLERIGTGGVQTNISYRDIQNILIPVLPKSTQEKIAELVRKSHEARKKSKELLEEAKRKVEDMIEKGGGG